MNQYLICVPDDMFHVPDLQTGDLKFHVPDRARKWKLCAQNIGPV